VLRAVVVNSKFSNVATGSEGLENARRMAAAAAAELGVPAGHVLVSSTGVIGVQLPIGLIEGGLKGMSSELQSNPLVGAEGIMTTDTYPKAISCKVDGATIAWVAKGSGMIEPNMATMLAYIFTDAAFSAAELSEMLRDAVEVSFNMLSVDSDTSTSDTCVILANGRAGQVGRERFAAALTAGCIRMAEILARDGEGAEHLIRATVSGAANAEQARRVAKSLVNSPLVKTMVHGADPNVGRLLMAVGKCFDCEIAADRTDASINGHMVVRQGLRLDFDDAVVRATLRQEVVELAVNLNVGDGSATAFGCDLSNGYITENASYSST
jgi:glutamate N-acetyltransferase/amino-acid N-acetyltransferase